jgi:alkanesulfonate monooxygenase SsuD/methylene tetrahydromethanopterin reductase-like flavin-dependent oxidoreductase (luciferase family)
VAARTERIAVFGNVLNPPLRQPLAVLARAVASLGLLSGGQVSLGIGAGFFKVSMTQDRYLGRRADRPADVRRPGRHVRGLGGPR